MKKLLVINLLALIFLSGVSPVFAQRLGGVETNVRGLKNPVTYQTAQAFSEGRGVWIQWTTEIEKKNLGFYVYRVVGGTREAVSSFISGALLRAREEKITAGSYSFFDAEGDVNSTYVIESVNGNGRRYDSSLIQTKTVADLKAVAGASTDEFFTQARNASPVATGSESLLPADLAAEVEANRPTADPIRQRWVAAQPGVKIGVKKEGLYRVSRQSLQDAGFDVESPRVLWQLYANGVEQAINVSDNGDYIEFYGKGIDRTESDTQFYFLVVGETDGKRVGTIARRRIGSGPVSESYAQTFSKKERVSYSSDYLNGDQENFYGTIITNSGGTVDFNISGVDPNAAAATIELTIFGLTLLPHQTKVLLNNVELGTLSGNLQQVMTASFTFPASVLREGPNSLKMISFAGPVDYSAFNSMRIGFARRYRAEQSQLSFHVPNYRTVYASNFTSPNIRVFDTTAPDTIKLINNLNVEPQTGGTYRVVLPSSRGRVMFAVEDSAIMTPAIVKQNEPSTLSTAARNGSFVIISHKDFMAQAETWANYRRNQGMTVEVVNIEDVFDEFNYGIFGADSIRGFLQYAKNNWQTPPSYVLLIGDATYDPRNHQGGPNRNFVPTRLVDTIYMETGSDDTLADFNDDGLAEIAIGRVAASTPAMVTTVFNKVVQFELTAQGLSRGAVFASDFPDGYDFEGLSGRLRDQLPTNIPRVMINRGQAGANASLVSEINSGRYLVNYSGHGTITTWASGGFFSNTHAAALNNGNNLSMVTMMTCLTGYFIYSDDSLAEALINNQNGGSVMSWASSGLTTPDIQEVMATRFFAQIAAGNITRVGDLVKDAKTTINFGRDVRLSWVLLGDPTMKVR